MLPGHGLQLTAGGQPLQAVVADRVEQVVGHALAGLLGDHQGGVDQPDQAPDDRSAALGAGHLLGRGQVEAAVEDGQAGEQPPLG